MHLKRLGKKTFPTLKGPQVGAAHTAADWTARHPEMAVGQPQKATRKKGEKILSLWTDELVAILRRIKRDRATLAAVRAYARKARPGSPRRRK